MPESVNILEHDELRALHTLRLQAKETAHALNNTLTALLCRWELLTLTQRDQRTAPHTGTEIKQLLDELAAQVRVLARACQVCDCEMPSGSSELCGLLADSRSRSRKGMLP